MDDGKSKPQNDRWIKRIYPKKEKIKKTYVYGLIDPRDRSLFWVGITDAPDLRYDRHIGKNKYFPGKDGSNPGKLKLVEDIIASGNQPGMVIIDEFDSRDVAYSLEQNLTAFLFGVGKINLKAIECRADKNWYFKPRVKAERQGQTWHADERLVLIGLYKRNTPCGSIEKILQRSRGSILFELIRAENAGFLTMREDDRRDAERAAKGAKLPVRNLDDREKEEVSCSLYKVTTKYGALNADHMRQGFVPKKD